MCLIIHFLAFDISKKIHGEWESEIVVSGRNGNGNRFLTREWVGMGMGMVLWEWEGMGTELVLPAPLYITALWGLWVRSPLTHCVSQLTANRRG